jgi:hypothetical protein
VLYETPAHNPTAAAESLKIGELWKDDTLVWLPSAQQNTDILEHTLQVIEWLRHEFQPIEHTLTLRGGAEGGSFVVSMDTVTGTSSSVPSSAADIADAVSVLGSSSSTFPLSTEGAGMTTGLRTASSATASSATASSSSSSSSLRSSSASSSLLPPPMAVSGRLAQRMQDAGIPIDLATASSPLSSSPLPLPPQHVSENVEQSMRKAVIPIILTAATPSSSLSSSSSSSSSLPLAQRMHISISNDAPSSQRPRYVRLYFYTYICSYT